MILKHYRVKLQLFLLVLCIIITQVINLHAQGEDIRFRHLSIEEGLSQSFGQSIVQDNNGFIWIGTEAGLNKYDGYSFEVYDTDPKNPNSLSNKHINTIFKDKEGVFWIGTEWGLNRFDPSSNQFTKYFHNPEDSNSLSNNWIWSIVEDQFGELWIGTENGLNRFNRTAKRFTRFKSEPDDPHCISNNKVRCVYINKQGILWIGTEKGGLNKLDREKERFIIYLHHPDNPNSLSSNTVLSICEDVNGQMWIGTYGGGLNKFDPVKKQFTHYRRNPDDPASISDDYINVLFKDKTGILWIGTENGGLNVFKRGKEQFITYRKEPDNLYSLSNDRILSICEDSHGDIWVGTRGGGVSLYNRETQKFKHYKTQPGNPNSLNNNMIWQLYEDRKGILWIATDNGGLNKFDRKKNTFTHYMHDPDDPYSISYNRVLAILEDNAGVFWIGTFGGLHQFNPETGRFINYRHDTDDPHSLSSDKVLWIHEDKEGMLWMGTKGGGLNKYDRKTGRFTHYMHDPDNPASLSHDRVYCILEDRQGVLWIGTIGGGLDKFDRTKEEFINYAPAPDDPNSLSENGMFCIFEDTKGRLWIGTRGGGLNLFDREKERFTIFTKKDGLPDNTVYKILEDDNGNLWLSTNLGLSKFNPETGVFKNYDSNDGLQSNEFNSGAACKSKSGEMFFGGINGFNVFFPDSIRDNPHLPRVVISDFLISNKSVPIGRGRGGRTILQKTITETDEIVLSYTDDVLSFEFAALHFVSPENNQYAYMMEGIDKEWNFLGTRRYVTFSDLSPGKYVLRIKATNNDGVWNEQGTRLKIMVIPPYWETWWFYTLCILFLIGLSAALYRYRLKQMEEEERLRVITDISHALEHGQATVYRRSFGSDEYEYIGKGIENITGFSPEEFTLSLWRKILITINVVGDLEGLSVEEAFDRMREGKIDNFVMDNEFRTKSGDIRWVRDITTALRDASGACYATLGILFEITDRKIAEQELVRISDELLISSKELGLKNKEMEKDLNLAREIQMALLAKRHYYFPIDLPKDQSVLQFTHHYLPASKLAGDFFEIFPISDNKVGFLICDVIGHGTRASLLTFYLRGLIEQLRPDANDPEMFISKLNSGFISIVSRFDSAFFATMFYCVTDSDSCRLRYVNAGHPMPFVLRRSQGLVRKIEENGAKRSPAIGIQEDFAFSTNEHMLSDDDIVFFFTDGLYEVLGNDEKIFGNKRLFETIQNKLSATPSRMMEEVLSEIQNYAEGNDFEDDVCMVTMHVNKHHEA